MTDEYPQDTLKRWISSDVGLTLITIGFYIAFYLTVIWVDGFWWRIEHLSSEAMALFAIMAGMGMISATSGFILILRWFDQIYNERF